MEKIDLRNKFITKLKKDGNNINIPKEYMLLRNQDYCEWLEKRLLYEIISMRGFWVFDCEPEDLLNKLNNSQSDAHNLVCEDFEQLNKDWIRFCKNKNYKRSPFFKIKNHEKANN